MKKAQTSKLSMTEFVKVGDRFENKGLLLEVIRVDNEAAIFKCIENYNKEASWTPGQTCPFPNTMSFWLDNTGPGDDWRLVPKKSENYQTFYDRVK